MKTLILFYSRSGNTKAIALKKSEELGCDIEEIFDVQKPSILSAVFGARKRKKVKIVPIKSNLDDYEKIIIMSPVWAAHPVPAINQVIECLPANKKIEVIMVSAGGGTMKSTEETKKLIAMRNCEVVGYIDLKAKRKNNEVFLR
jgi:flavodoxin